LIIDRKLITIKKINISIVHIILMIEIPTDQKEIITQEILVVIFFTYIFLIIIFFIKLNNYILFI